MAELYGVSMDTFKKLSLYACAYPSKKSYKGIPEALLNKIIYACPKR